jgi:8-oxo-dGTP diphosphatase
VTVPARLHVAVGVIEDAAGRVLVALRPARAHQGGLWEFPGGKCEPGESVQTALARELQEELGITPLQSTPLCRIRHDYADRQVLLDVWRVTHFSGSPAGLEGQPLRWVEPELLEPAEFPQANRAIIRRLQLPPLLPITGLAASPDDFLERFAQLLTSGHRLVMLRAPELPAAHFHALARRCLSLTREHGARLLLNADSELLQTVPAAGIHLNAQRLHALRGRTLEDSQLLGASCHSLEELQRAEALGADYALLSPVLPTRSHPGQPALGWEAFAACVGAVGIPVYALGGLAAGDLVTAKRHGALGIAGISTFWDTTC